MNLQSTNRHLPVWMLSGFIGLSFLVFAWGLGYKLSLYDPPQSYSHKMPQAKLLSKNEQAIASQSPLLSDTKASPAVFTSVLLLLILAYRSLNIPASDKRDFAVKRSWRLRHRTGLNFFFVLPPPVLS
ncbi:hypothetical protein [Terracidiphilus sp.]|uniref:hypothetical protein n=1 Tax=Terracidiphilus sp. TaxID=1964191 RepID=UPI003C26CD7A